MKTPERSHKSRVVSGIIDYGMIVIDNFSNDLINEKRVTGYIILPKYSHNLEEHFHKMGKIDPGFVFNVT